MEDRNTVLFEELLTKIDKRLPFLGMNPLNEESEKDNFFDEDDYNPEFGYASPSLGCEKLFRKADEIELKDCVICNLLKQKLEKFKKTNAMMQGIGSDEFTFFSKQIFGVPDKALVNKAHSILKKERVKEEDSITSKQVFEVMEKVLEKFKLEDWSVGMKNMTANAAVLVSKKKVYIKKGATFPLSFLKRVIVHEIGTHVFRAANGEKQPYKIFRTGLPNYLMTEEGMAVNAEEMNDCLKINTLRIYAGRVLAVHYSLEAGFRDVFNELRKYFYDKLAWKLTLRAKRGLTDASKPGAYTKDHLYLKGYYEVREFLKEKGDAGLTMLYHGRIGLEHVPLMKKIKDLKKPELTPASPEFRRILGEITL